MKADRPVNLDLTTLSLPLSAITSILHRISGVFLFIGTAFMVWMLHKSLASPADFAAAQNVMEHGLAKFITWGLLSSLAYHLVAGIKHLIMDTGIGETKEGGKLGAQITIVVSVVLFILAGVWVW
ncbi:succinate dehydrogenase, cytochrome b556 subunit [Salinispirillum marinum]|uniref:Succinate dehydrogenase cytochrome b556 subunit n=2 Tax=Saccharospirillaceae TaxID=255527 RepID=A0ABV8BGY1_9GAMM